MDEDRRVKDQSRVHGPPEALPGEAKDRDAGREARDEAGIREASVRVNGEAAFAGLQPAILTAGR